MKNEKEGGDKRLLLLSFHFVIAQPLDCGVFCHLFVEKGGAKSHPVYAFGLRVHPKSYSGRLKRVCKQTGPSVYAFWMHSLDGVGIDGEGQKEKWKVEKGKMRKRAVTENCYCPLLRFVVTQPQGCGGLLATFCHQKVAKKSP